MELLEQAGIADKLPEWRKIAEAAQFSSAQLAGKVCSSFVYNLHVLLRHPVWPDDSRQR